MDIVTRFLNSYNCGKNGQITYFSPVAIATDMKSIDYVSSTEQEENNENNCRAPDCCFSCFRNCFR